MTRSKNFFRSFLLGQRVLLFNSRLPLFPGKLRSRCSFVVKDVTPYGVVELQVMDGTTFKVNAQGLKYYCGDEERHIEALYFKE